MAAVKTSRTLLNVGLAILLAGLVFAAIFDSPRAAARQLGYCESSASDWFGRQLPWLWNPCLTLLPASFPRTGLPVAYNSELRVHGQRVVRLTDDWLYCDDATGSVIKVPKDFFTDYATIPSYVRFIFDPAGDNIEAAIVHDWLYSVGQDDESWNRVAADRLFRAILKESGVNIIKRNIMYAAVRLGGGGHFAQGSGIEMRRPDWEAYIVARPSTSITEARKTCEGFDLPPRGYHIDQHAPATE